MKKLCVFALVMMSAVAYAQDDERDDLITFDDRLSAARLRIEPEDSNPFRDCIRNEIERLGRSRSFATVKQAVDQTCANQEQAYREALIREGATPAQARGYANFRKRTRIEAALPPMVPLQEGDDPF